jgi:mRNA-degrading endonuclease toxin of MazEF toxin-antitoxin module
MNAQIQQAPPKVAPRLTGAPKIRQLYWCDFPQDAQLPEFWKRRPVIVLSYRNTLHGAVTVVPCSTQAQPGNKWAFPLQTTIDGRAAFAICDKITTLPTREASCVFRRRSSTICCVLCLAGCRHRLCRPRLLLPLSPGRRGFGLH